MPLALVGLTIFIATNRPTQTSGTSWAGYPCLPLNTALRSSASCLNGFSSATVIAFGRLLVGMLHLPEPVVPLRSEPRGCVMRRREKPPAEKQKTNMGGSNANIESRRGTQYYNPSRSPPHSLQVILADLETNTRAGFLATSFRSCGPIYGSLILCPKTVEKALAILLHNLDLAYIFVAMSTQLLMKSFTFMSMCGMNQDLASARILLSLSPPITPIRALALRTQTVPLSDPQRNPCLNRLRDV